MDSNFGGSEAKGPAHRIVCRARRPPHRSRQDFAAAATRNFVMPPSGALRLEIEIPVRYKCFTDTRDQSSGRVQAVVAYG